MTRNSWKSFAAAWQTHLRTASPAQIEAFLAALRPGEAQRLLHAWPLWARPSQLPPPGDWRVWLLMAGRGFGKTRAGAEWVRSLAAQAGLVAAEAGGASWLQRNWRPITMLSFLGLVVADAFGLLAFRLADQAWLLLQIGLGGYVVGRSVEKISPQISAIAGPAGTAASERPRPKPNGTPRAKSTGRAGHAKSG